jgi:hypothetical protein
VPADRLDQLFRAPEEEFTAKRNELARSLREDGEGEAADWLKSLKKPSKAAWLVNQLATRKPKEVGELLEAGAELRQVQEEMLAGAPDRDKLRDAAASEQRVIDSLLRTAEAIGREHGVGSQILTRVGETLQAASSDTDVAEAIERGHLVKEQRAAGVGLAGAMPAPAKDKAKGKDDVAEQRARAETAKRRKAAERELATVEKRLEKERDGLERAREKVEEHERRVHSAELDANAARRALDEL